MSLLPSDAKKIEIENSTVDFFEFVEDGSTVYYFDSSECAPPEPMINAMLGLQLLKGADKKLIMINHKAPSGLFPKIENDFNFEVSNIEDDKVRVEFNSKNYSTTNTDFSQNSCQ
ncbi:hypothetical protein [Arcobacter sp. LA11]|uniref:hypothetical protein n=1 Tax=Arcobacter sp. LA11 TaxID=1898176 RepID=UPI00093335B2|nr:hypothetical protein [Arcobacter sp. LA11]